MCPERTPEMFDAWALDYDNYIGIGKLSFPFSGYDSVLDRIVELANPKPGLKILDIGIGTGNLAQKFLEYECEIWGIDYSSRMLEEAKKKLPNVKLVLADIMSEWPSDLRIGFDRIVSAYTLHHLRIEGKVTAVQRMAKELLRENGRLIIGDISFLTAEARVKARANLETVWDDDEYYWAADEFKDMMLGNGFTIDYEQISEYGGIYIIKYKQNRS